MFRRVELRQVWRVLSSSGSARYVKANLVRARNGNQVKVSQGVFRCVAVCNGRQVTVCCVYASLVKAGNGRQVWDCYATSWHGLARYGRHGLSSFV